MQLSPRPSTLTPEANLFAPRRSTKPKGQRKKAHDAVSPSWAWRVRQSPCSWLRAENEPRPCGPSNATMHSEPGFPYLLRPAAKALIIGPGGGWDVARALASGSKDITGVEINPIIARDIMQEKFPAYSIASTSILV